MQLATCPECHRHVRVGETLCPFCNADLASTDLTTRVQNRPIQGNRFGRAALVSFSAVLASSTAACGSDDDGTGEHDQTQTHGGAGGTVADDSGASGGTASGGMGGAGMGGSAGISAGGTGGLAQPVYGIPIDPPDAGANIGQPEYGVPIDFDASAPAQTDAGAGTGSDDGGLQVQPVYGIPIDPSEP